ncbi:MAG: winged helix-turn-helix transcriptional regulator [Rhizobiaceae bacterium]|nr:winged helix-turn-helix transcriptional regulator [Rhizobiaceae bacterium]
MTYQIAITALADPRRRSIFESLRGNPLMVAEIARLQPVSRPAVSQHLKALEQAGLVTVEAQGTRRYYGVRREGLADLRKWIDGFWGDVLDSFAAEVNKQEELKKENE